MKIAPVDQEPDNVAPDAAAGSRAYALGHTSGEFRRLEYMDAFFRDLTEDVFRRAGIAPGMRVLDVGCGPGDVSMLAARMVGRSGAVLGIDRSADAVDTAQRRAAAAGLHWVRFAQSELDAFSTEEKFDALVGRLILMYMRDAAATLRRLCGYLNGGGIIAFQEMSIQAARSVPNAPLFDQVTKWIFATFERTGAPLDMGGQLFGVYLRAGLPAPQMISSGRVEGGAQSAVYEIMTGVLRSLVPAAERFGVATAAEIGIDTLASRLRDEAVANQSCILAPVLIGAWTRAGSNR
jgi:2-polyprenyl-3-methyl-5-hydroxy-6-metoxy-1,4-benzoquinol methylase